MAGADPGFPVLGGADPLGGHQHTILSNFPKNYMKSREFWAMGGGPPKSATVWINFGGEFGGGSSDRLTGGGKRHEIYAAAFGNQMNEINTKI